jgi:hypothetical protein
MDVTAGFPTENSFWGRLARVPRNTRSLARDADARGGADGPARDRQPYKMYNFALQAER